jgi:hypothetical protein
VVYAAAGVVPNLASRFRAAFKHKPIGFYMASAILYSDPWTSLESGTSSPFHCEDSTKKDEKERLVRSEGKIMSMFVA